MPPLGEHAVAVPNLPDLATVGRAPADRSEPRSADGADLEALVSRNHHDLVEPVLERLLAR